MTCSYSLIYDPAIRADLSYSICIDSNEKIINICQGFHKIDAMEPHFYKSS